MIKQKKMNRKAQITLYIIIGIIILLAVILIIYLTYGARKAEVQRTVPEVSTMPLAYRSAEIFITDCLEQTAETALRELGAHGGWISVRNPLLFEKEFNIDIVKPYDSDVVSMDKMGNNLVPYWWHVKTPYGCGTEVPCFATQENVPTITEMEEQMNIYIKKHLPECFNEFKDLRKQGFEITELGPLEIDSRILLENMIFYMKYPLKIKKGDQVLDVESFAKALDLNFRQIYNQAFTITSDEINGQRLENSLFLNLLGIYSDVDFNKLPPIAATTEGYDIVVWPKVMVETKVKDLLKLYTPFIRVNGTANGMRLTDPNPMAQGIYDSLFFSMFEDYKFPDTQINYYFLDWPIDFHVTPPAGPGILKPKSYKTEYPFGIWQSSQRNLYEFFYDISFPVVVEIYDSKALGGKGYSFFFALEGNILDNKNLLDWNQGLGTVSWDQSIYSIEINPDAGGTHTLEGGEAIFGQFNASNEFVLNATTPIHTKSLFDRFEQKISNVTIYTKDKKTGQYLTEVAVEFICGRYKAASLGATELLEDGKSGIITKAPICYGDGRLRFDLINYDTLTLGPISTEVDGNLILTAELEPVRQQEVSFKKVARIEPSGENITVTNIYQDLQFYEKAIVILQKEKTSPYDSKLSVALSFDTAENKIVEIPPGQYSINVIIMDSRNMTIQPEKRVYKVDDEDYEVWIPPEPIEFDELMSGGLEYNNNTCGLVNIHDYELDADNVLEIRSLLIKRPFIRVEDISELGRIAEYTNTSCTTLRPRFI